jgi:aminoglycoside phosphotransferase (APT) family kinase protein
VTDQISDLLAPARLEAFLRERTGRTDRLTIEGRAFSGSSNITAFMRFGDDRLVVRRPPPGELLPTAHDMMREVKFLEAFAGTDVPVARVIASSDDASVMGSPFYVMTRIDGVVLQQDEPAHLREPGAMDELCARLVEVLVAIHAEPWEGRDLPGRPTGYLDRQIKRWIGQLHLTPSARRLIGLDDVTNWIIANVPGETTTTIVHGDFGLHNMILGGSTPSVEAVLDWEMATLGDPLADLVWFLQDWGQAREGRSGNPANYVTTWPGAWSRERMLEHYARTSGRDLSDEHFYRVFSTWKGIIVTEGLYSAFLDGTAANPAVARFETEIPTRVEYARELVRT